jgi:hypothetical protein
MTTNFWRAAAAAFLIGGAGMVSAAIVIYPQAAEAAGVRPAVYNPLKEAISLAGSGNGSAALAKVREAESGGGHSAAEQQAISQTKEYIAAKTGQGTGSAACRAKFANDYNAGRYRDAISDSDCLRKNGSFSGQDQLIVAQAEYLLGDCAAAIRDARAIGAQQLLLAAAHKCGDADTERTALEQLVRGGKTQYWTNLLTAAENSSHVLKDHETLDLLRLRLLTNTMRDQSDYMTAAELALQVGSAQEAANIVQKGIDAKVLSGDRPARLLTLAKAQAAKDSADFPAMQKAAAAAKSGDPAIKLSEELWGFGRYADALSLAQSAIEKGVTDKNNAQIRLGQAELGAGHKDAAESAFDKVGRDDPAEQVIAHLWAVYASVSR